METVRFYTDPLCPWAWQGAKWIREVSRVRPVRIEWGLFSLFLANEHHEEFDDETRERYLLGVRTLALVRREHGNDGLGAAYLAVGRAVHEDGLTLTADVARDALAAAGLDTALVDRSLADPSTAAEVEREHRAIVDEVGAFGVPTIVLESGRGMFGPVKAVAPEGQAAGELWDHTRWLIEQDDFFELKRPRDRRPGEVREGRPSRAA